MTDEDEDYQVTHKKNKTRAALLRKHELDDIRVVMKTPAGRRLLWRIIDESQMLGSGLFVPGQPDVTDHNLGQREIGLWLYNEIMTADAQTFAAMIVERSKINE